MLCLEWVILARYRACSAKLNLRVEVEPNFTCPPRSCVETKNPQVRAVGAGGRCVTRGNAERLVGARAMTARAWTYIWWSTLPIWRHAMPHRPPPRCNRRLCVAEYGQVADTPRWSMVSTGAAWVQASYTGMARGQRTCRLGTSKALRDAAMVKRFTVWVRAKRSGRDDGRKKGPLGRRHPPEASLLVKLRIAWVKMIDFNAVRPLDKLLDCPGETHIDHHPSSTAGFLPSGSMY